MKNDNGSLSFDIRLELNKLRQDVAAANRQLSSIATQAHNTGMSVDSGMSSMSRNVSGHIQQMAGGIKSAFADMAKQAVGFSALMGSGAFLKDLFDESKAFTKQMKIVSTISQEVAADMEGYKERVLDLCTQIAVAPETAAAALYQINSAGHLGADGMKVLAASAKAAVGGVTETAVAADAITTILNAYRFKADDAEAISDKLFTTVRLGKTTMDELGRSIAYVAPLAATYKISIDEVLAAVAQLTKQGNSTQNAMTQISASIQAVAAEMGDTAFENGLMAALAEVEKRADGSNAALKAQLSNIRAVRGALGLTKENAAETAEFVNLIKNSAGAANQAAETMGKGSAAEIRKLRTNFLKELKDFGDGMTKTLATLSEYMNRAFESGNMHEVLKTIKELVVAYGAYKAVIIVCTALTMAYKVTMAQMAVQQALAAASQQKLTKAQALGTVATMQLQRAFKALWAGMGGWIGVLAMAAFAIYKYITRTTEAEKAQKRLNQAISTTLTETASEKREIEKLLTTLKTAKRESQDYKDAKDKIISQYGQYLQGIINERGEITNLAEAYRILSQEATKAARARALETMNEEAATDFAGSNKSAAKALRTALKAKGVSDKDIDSMVARTIEAVGATGTAPSDIREKYGITNESFEAAFRKYYMESSDIRGTPEERQERLNNVRLPKLRKSGEWKRGIRSYDDMKMALHSMGYVDAPKMINKMSTQGYLGSSTVNDALKKFETAQKTYAETTAKNEQYLNLGTLDRSQFEGIDDDAFDINLDYLKNTVLPKMTNGEYGKGGVGFKFTGTKQQTFKTEEELRSFIQQMELEKRDRQIAAQLGEGAEGGDSADTKTLAQTIADMIAQSKSVSEVGEVASLKEKMKDALEKGLKVGDESLDTGSKDYKDLKAAYEALKKRTPGAGSGDGGETQQQLNAKVVASRQQGLNLELAQNRDRIRLMTEQELQLEEAKARLMEEGAAKRARLRELEAQRQLIELEKQMHDQVQAVIDGEKSKFDAQEQVNATQAAANGNNHYAPRTFTAGLLRPEELSMGDQVVDTQNVGNMSAEAVGEINRLLAHYKQLQEAMTEATGKELTEAAQNAYDEYLRNFGDFLQRRQAIRDMADREYAAAATEGERRSIRAQESKDLAEVDAQQTKTASPISAAFGDISSLSQAAVQQLIKRMEAARSKIVETLNPDLLKDFDAALESLHRADISAYSDEIGQLAPKLAEIVLLQRQLNDEEATQEALRTQRDILQQEADSLVSEEDNANADLMLQKVNELTLLIGASEAKVTNIRAKLKEVSKIKFSDYKRAANDLAKVGQRAAEFAGYFDDDITDAIKKGAGALSEMTEAIDDIQSGISALAKSGQAMIDTVADAAVTTVDAAATGMKASSASAAASMSTMEKASVILTIISAAIQLATAIMSLIDTDAKKEKEIKRLQKEVDRLQQSYDRLGRAVQRAYSYDASYKIYSQNVLLQKQLDLLRRMIAEEESKRKTDEDKVDQWKKQISELKDTIADNKEAMMDAVMGEDIKSAISNFADAYASMFDGGISKARASKDLVKNMIKTMVLEAMKSDLSAPVERLRSMMNSFFRGGKIEEHEEKLLQELAEAEMDNIANKYSWADKYLKDTATQGGGSSMFNSMSQETGDELNGRFTAIQEHTTAIRDNMTAVQSGLSDINSSLAHVWYGTSLTRNTVEELRDISLLAINHLEAISRNTHELYQMNERLGKIEKNTSRL